MKIFKTLIQKGKGIEVNTSGYRDLKTCGFPNFEQVHRYYDLGGRIITIGTDSHTSDRVGENCLNVAKNIRKLVLTMSVHLRKEKEINTIVLFF